MPRSPKQISNISISAAISPVQDEEDNDSVVSETEQDQAERNLATSSALEQRNQDLLSDLHTLSEQAANEIDELIAENTALLEAQRRLTTTQQQLQRSSQINIEAIEDLTTRQAQLLSDLEIKSQRIATLEKQLAQLRAEKNAILPSVDDRTTMQTVIMMPSPTAAHQSLSKTTQQLAAMQVAQQQLINENRQLQDKLDEVVAAQRSEITTDHNQADNQGESMEIVGLTLENEDLKAELKELRNKKTESESTQPAPTNDTLETIMRDAFATITLATTHQQAYQQHAKKYDIGASLFFKHRDSGVKNALLVTEKLTADIQKVMSELQKQVFTKTSKPLTPEEFAAFRKDLGQAILNLVDKTIQQEKFSSYTSHSFRAYLHHYRSKLKENHGLINSQTNQVVTTSAVHDSIQVKAYNKKSMKDMEQNIAQSAPSQITHSSPRK